MPEYPAGILIFPERRRNNSGMPSAATLGKKIYHLRSAVCRHHTAIPHPGLNGQKMLKRARLRLGITAEYVAYGRKMGQQPGMLHPLMYVGTEINPDASPVSESVISMSVDHFSLIIS